MKVIVIRSYICEKCGWTAETEDFEIHQCEQCRADIEPAVVYDESLDDKN
jgi:hypothetical protein